MGIKKVKLIDYIIEIIERINACLTKYRQKFNGAAQSEKYLSLAARSDLDKIDSKYSEYEKRLLWALENNDLSISNIALTGYYGAGKTSVLKTFQSRNKQFKYLNISLATFQDDEDTNISLKYIEAGILKQIFYKAKDSDIPNSHYDKIREISKGRKFFILTILTILVFLIDNLFFNNNFVDFFKPNAQSIFLKIIFFLIVFTVSYYFLGIISNFTINRIGYKNLDIEIAKQTKGGNVLNRFLDELIYIFKKKKFNVVIFEDIDRFNNTQIFTNLREINYILNNTEIIKNRIFFIYAIKDDQFKSAIERTKFFDFIIPVIPVVNFETSVKTFKKLFSSDEQKILKYIIEDVVIYIDDMRLLNNIFNEFQLFNGKINIHDSLSIEKLLAVIIFKNLEPKDYALFSQNKGSLKGFIDNKNYFITILQTSLNEKITSLQKKITSIENESLESIKDLRKIYVLEQLNYLHTSGTFKFFKVDNEIISIDALIDNDDYFNAFKNNKLYYTNSSHNSTFPFSKKFEQFESKLHKKTYDERADIILNKSSIKNLQLQLQNLYSEKERIAKKTLKDLISDLNPEQLNLNDFENIQNKKTVIRLLREGYIDEDFKYYLSQFEGLNFTKNDFFYFQNVKNYQHTEFNYTLDNVSNLINNFSPSDFNSLYILNNNLIDELFRHNNSEWSSERNDILNILKSEDEIILKFLGQFINNVSNLPHFMNCLTESNPSIWNYVKKNSLLNTTIQQKFFESIVEHANVNSLIKINDLSNLRKDINSHPTILNIISPEKIKKIINDLNIKFEDLNSTHIDKSGLKIAYENNAYEINFNNISILLKLVGGYNEDNYSSKVFTFLKLNTDLNKMYDYISLDQNIGEFIKSVVLEGDSRLEEFEDVIISLLNLSKEVLNLSLKKKVIQRLNSPISKIGSINEFEIQQILFKYNQIKASWKNVSTYYQTIKNNLKTEDLDQNLAEFLSIQDNAIDIGNEISNISIDQEFNKELIETIISNNQLPINCYEKLVERLPYKEAFFKRLKYLEVSKAKILIEKKFIQLNPDHIYILTKEKKYELALLLIKYHEDDIKESIENIIIEIDDNLFNYILKSKGLKVSTKSLLINHLPQSRYNKKNKDAIIDVILKYKKIHITKDLKVQISNFVIEENYISLIFNLISDQLKIEDFRKYFIKQIPENYRKLGEAKGRPKFKANLNNKIMLDKLLEYKMVKEPVLETKNGNKFYRVNKIYK